MAFWPTSFVIPPAPKTTNRKRGPCVISVKMGLVVGSVSSRLVNSVFAQLCMNRRQPIPLWFLQEYLALVSREDPLDEEERLRQLIFHHAELNYKLFGGGRCSLCNSAVRHIIPVEVQKEAQSIHYACLCTRCIEGERATAKKLVLHLGRGAVEYKPRSQDRAARRWQDSAADQPGKS